MWFVVLLGVGLIALAHTAPAPFLLDALAGKHAVWHMPRGDPATLYFTFDDGPNPTTTPALLDLLARENVRATFFLIDRHITEETAPIVKRVIADGHAIGIHSDSRAWMLASAKSVASRVERAAAHVEQVAGASPCRIFRPHAGWRTTAMFEAVRRLDYRVVGWGWMLWDWNWFRTRTAESVYERILPRVRSGDIIVLHDGDEKAPTADQKHTVDATARLIPQLRARGFTFGTICNPNADR